MILSRPELREYGEYYGRYIDLVKHDDPIWQMRQNFTEMSSFLKRLPAAKWEYAYDEGKWSFKKLIVHIIDTERIMSTRALRIARGEEQRLTGFDHNQYAENSCADDRCSISIFNEYKTLRPSTLELFKSLDEYPLCFIGNANNVELSPRAIAYILAGHEMHHLTVIRDKYFPEEF